MQGCRFARLIGYDGGMLRFRLSTLLICISVAAVVLSYCMNVLTVESTHTSTFMTFRLFWINYKEPEDDRFDLRFPMRRSDGSIDGYFYGYKGDLYVNLFYPVTYQRIQPPTRSEVLWRLVWAEPLALITTLLAIKGVRKLWRSIPHKGRPEFSQLD